SRMASEFISVSSMRRHPPWKCPNATQSNRLANAVSDSAASSPRALPSESGVSSDKPANASAAPPQPMVHRGMGKVSTGTNSQPSAIASGGRDAAKNANPIVLMMLREVLTVNSDVSSGCAIMAEDWASQIGLDRRSQ